MNYFLHKFKRLRIIDLVCAIPLISLLIFTREYLGESPSLDPMVLYRESTQFFNGGVKEILKTGTLIHPPLIYILNYFSFLVFGKNTLSYNISGILLYSTTSIFGYFYLKKIFNRKLAIAFTLLLFLNPRVIINSFYLTNDMLLLCGFLFASIFYATNSRLLFSLVLMLIALMKETGLVIIGSFYILSTIPVFFKKYSIRKKMDEITNIAFLFIPSVSVFFLWNGYLKFLGSSEWRESFFIKTNDSSFLVILKRIFNFNFLDKFFFQNLHNLFIFHFQWIFTASLLFFGIIQKFKIKFASSSQKKFFYSIFLVGIIYIIFVLSFPTWTVPRYGLPVFVSVFFILSYYLSSLKNIFLYTGLLIILFCITIFSNFFAIDPLMSGREKEIITNTKFYTVDFWNRGPDRIIYNLDFLKAVKKQNKIIKTAISENTDLLVTNCNDLKLGEKLWSMSIHNDFYPIKFNKKLDCINIFELEDPKNLEKIAGKRILIDGEYKSKVDELLNKSKE